MEISIKKREGFRTETSLCKPAMGARLEIQSRVHLAQDTELGEREYVVQQVWPWIGICKLYPLSPQLYPQAAVDLRQVTPSPCLF